MSRCRLRLVGFIITRAGLRANAAATGIRELSDQAMLPWWHTCIRWCGRAGKRWCATPFCSSVPPTLQLSFASSGLVCHTCILVNCTHMNGVAHLTAVILLTARSLLLFSGCFACLGVPHHCLKYRLPVCRCGTPGRT